MLAGADQTGVAMAQSGRSAFSAAVKNTMDWVRYNPEVCLVYSSVGWESIVKRQYLGGTS